MTVTLARVPCTIVTGFLGAGKTTLIRHVLANAQGRRLAVIVNEFGDVGIDGEILKGCGDRRLPGGEHRRARQWLPVLHGGRRVRAGARRHPRRDARGRAHRDRDLRPRAAEAAGAGLPLAGDQEPRHRRRRRGGGRWRGARRRPRRRRSRGAGRASAPPTPRSSTTIRSRKCSRTRSPAPISSCSTSAICSTPPASTKALAADRRRAAARGQGRPVADGKVDPAALLGLGIGTEDDIDEPPHPSRRRGRARPRRFRQLRRGAARDRRSGRAGRARRRAGRSHDVLRVKGFAAVAGKPMRLLVQAVGARVTHQYDRPWAAAETRAGPSRRDRAQGPRPRRGRTRDRLLG